MAMTLIELRERLKKNLIDETRRFEDIPDIATEQISLINGCHTLGDIIRFLHNSGSSEEYVIADIVQATTDEDQSAVLNELV